MTQEIITENPIDLLINTIRFYIVLDESYWKIGDRAVRFSGTVCELSRELAILPLDKWTILSEDRKIFWGQVQSYGKEVKESKNFSSHEYSRKIIRTATEQLRLLD